MTPGKKGQTGFTPGRYVLAATDAAGARDMPGLTSQVKFMRECFESLGHRAALMLLVVGEDEQDEAVRRIKAALEEL